MWRALTITLFALMATSAHPASFECNKGRLAPDERIVCKDPLLSSLDTRLAEIHAKAKERDPDLTLETSRDFLADRKTCGANRACVLATYVAVIETLGDLEDLPQDITANTIAGGRAKASSTLPAKIGQCVETKITSVHPRIGDNDPPLPEDYDSGTGIEFANDGYQVSYDREEALIASKAGDRVTMCLISIPHRCPPGDDRGRGYFTTNTRTGQSWALGDSQHMCGGR